MFRAQTGTDLAICDFGLATHVHEPNYLFVRCGTPGFVAPEIINIKDMSTKGESISDMFSAGVIFYYLLFGHSIFPGKKYSEILAQNRSCDFDFSDDKYKKIPRDTLDLLMRMLEKDPRKRMNADDALQHPYFNNMMELDESSEETGGLRVREHDNILTVRK